jgi:uncharacterized membrane protein YkgB
MKGLMNRLRQIDRAMIDFMSSSALPLLRISLAINYIWFGALKIFGVSPVSDLVSKTVPFLPKKYFVPFLGVWEVSIGLALLFRIALRSTLLLFFLQLAGTFMTFIIRPQDTFQQGNPLLLTKDGEFVIKNLILLSAGLAVGSTARRQREEIPESGHEPLAKASGLQLQPKAGPR